MALSFSAVEKVYKVFNELKTLIPDLSIGAWPEDMSGWPENKRKTPEVNTVYGWDRKYDNGWENLFFFVRNPSDELKKKFDDLKSKVPNTSLSEPYTENRDLWVFGWF